MIKRIFVILLTIIITIPVNAAVSVSDGSAFVTKAELDSNFNGLSNRVFSLENTIEVKIDSLVSSYLSRNGIWNGTDQKLIEGYSSWKYGYGYKEAEVVRRYYMLATANNTPSGGYSSNKNESTIPLISIYYDSNNPIIKEGNLVEEISKTGLAIINTSYTDAETTDKRVVVCSYRPTSASKPNGIHGDQFMFEYLAKVEFFQDSQKLSSVQYSYLAQMAGLSIEIGAIPGGVLLMFVKKGSPLKIKYTAELKNNSGMQFSGTLGWFAGRHTSTRTWKVDKVTVY